MLTSNPQPTPHPDVNAILAHLLSEVQAIVATDLLGMYLTGSLASGDFDQDSDIDVIIVTESEMSDERFKALQAMHQRIAALDSWWATQMEVTYIARAALRRYDPAQTRLPLLERGKDERIKVAEYGPSWLVQCSILRERGITITGPAPQTLIDPISSNDLRLAMLARLHGWATQILNAPARISNRGYQSYTVLSLCRILYTLHHGTIVSKPVAAQWAQATLGEPWAGLIARAWIGRQQPNMTAEIDDVSQTQDLIRHVLERSQKFTEPTDAA